MKYVPGVGYVYALPTEVSEARRAAARARLVKGVPGKKINRTKKTNERHIPAEELSAMRSIIAKSRNRKPNGDFAPGSNTGCCAPGERRTVVKLPISTASIFRRCATAECKTAMQFCYDLALSLKSDPRYAHLFARSTEETPPEPQTK